MPDFPDDLLHWMRMDVTGLRPAEYWHTSVLDYEMATAVHSALRAGQAEADEAHRKALEQDREREAKQRESQQRLRERFGR